MDGVPNTTSPDKVLQMVYIVTGDATSTSFEGKQFPRTCSNGMHSNKEKANGKCGI